MWSCDEAIRLLEGFGIEWTIMQNTELTVDALLAPRTLTSDSTPPCQSKDAADTRRRLAEYALVMDPGVQVRLRRGVTHS